MITIRLFEEKVADLVESGEIATPCHLCIGQEAIAAGVCAALANDDSIWGAHRSHGHYLAKGGNLRALMAEIFCRTTGCSGGRGGSMHVCDPEAGILGTVPIVAATIPIAVGSAFASRLQSARRVSVVFFGDGATEEGHFHESLNLAGVHRLPVIFVCENNLYSSHMGIFERRLEDNIVESGAAHGMPAERLDGNDVEAVYAAAARAVQLARDGDGPTLLECRTFRWRGHVGPSWDMDVGVKRKDELQEWLKKDPIRRCANRLVAAGVSDEELTTVEENVRREIEEAVQWAANSDHPEPDSLGMHVYRAA
jgi:pyruvate dehydrogenase E1 component alpha subunit